MNPVARAFMLGVVSSFIGGIVFEYAKHKINKRRVLSNREPLGAFERGYWHYLPDGTAVWIPETGEPTIVPSNG